LQCAQQAHVLQVYNVSAWGEHPGGNVIFTTGGEDATDVFAAFHEGASMVIHPRTSVIGSCKDQGAPKNKSELA